MDWDDAYSVAVHIPDADDYRAHWAPAAAAFRARSGEADIDQPYGDHAREKYDLFMPEQAPAGLFVFVHGGYWMNFAKSYWSHLANGAVASGWAAAVPSYVLAPEARIGAITGQIAAAVTHAHKRVPGPIRLVGHSAGGHLVSRMLCEASPLPHAVADRIEHVVSISGVHDLGPLLKTKMNTVLKLTEAEVLKESPTLLAPRAGARLTAWVGEDERPEFIRQSKQLAQTWRGKGANTAFVCEPDEHHFSVIAGLEEPTSKLMRCVLG